MGVGTIDQALLAVLPVRFSTLRLFGLSQCILIVDEAHACDEYMFKALERMLEMQAAMRGSAIVMTATLTAALRTRLVTAFRAGLGEKDKVQLYWEYPALTIAARQPENSGVQKVESASAFVRSVPVERLNSSTDAIDRLIEQSSAGACCVWIRNTVDAVIRGAAELRERGVQVEIFHARFALHDRLEIAQRVVNGFGKKGREPDRRVTFWAPGDSDGGASEVSLSERRYEKFKDSLPDQCTQTKALIANWPEWRKRQCLTILVEQDGNICDGVRYDRLLGLLFDP